MIFLGFKFSKNGPIRGMDCLEIKEPDDSDWNGNQFLCWLKDLPDPGYRFQWSYYDPMVDIVKNRKDHCIS